MTRQHVQLRKQALSLNYFRMSWAEYSLMRHRRSDAWLRFRWLNCKHSLKDLSFRLKEFILHNTLKLFYVLYDMTVWHHSNTNWQPRNDRVCRCSCACDCSSARASETSAKSCIHCGEIGHKFNQLVRSSLAYVCSTWHMTISTRDKSSRVCTSSCLRQVISCFAASDLRRKKEFSKQSD